MKDTHASLPAPGIEVRHLRLVQAIASEGTVTRAASRLHLSQSAVSHQLVDLERDLGARLFDRVGKRMVITPHGERLLEGAVRVLTDLGTLERELRDLSGERRAPIRVATSCYTSYHWIPAVLARFARSHPTTSIEIVLEATRRCEEALQADEIDLAISTDPPEGPTWSTEVLVEGELVCAVSPTHEVFARRRGKKDPVLKWGDLRRTTILVHDIGPLLSKRLEDAVRASWWKESGERLGSPFTLQKIPLTEALVELVRAGVGAAIVDRWTVAPHARKDLVILPIVPRAPRTFHAVFRRANPRGLPLAELVALVRARIGASP